LVHKPLKFSKTLIILWQIRGNFEGKKKLPRIGA